MGINKVIHVFIGYDPREDAAAQVCKYSLQKHATVPVKVTMLHLKKLEDDGILWRPREKNASTQFTYSRFLVPSLMNFQGTAVFCDCDFLWVDDIAKLIAQVKPNKGVYVVPHDRYGYKPKTNTKMDGKEQTFYPKKNWSSMMVFNCGHPRVRTNLTRKHVNQESMQYLHRSEWVNKKDIGYLTPEWNWLSGYYEEIDKEMAKLFPSDHSNGSIAQTVAPVNGRASVKTGRKQRVVLSESERRTADKLGVPYEKYAQQKLKLQKGA